MSQANQNFTLEIAEGEAKGRSIPFSGATVIAGRQETCDMVLPGDPLVSRQHAKFTVENSQVWVENLGSLNGVYVNKTLISQKHPLKPGDEIVIGNHLVILRGAEAPSFVPPSFNNDAKAHSFGPGIRGTGKAQVQDAVRRLQLLYQFNKAATSTNSSSDLLRMILGLIFQDLRVERGVIFLYNTATNRLDPLCYKIRGQSDAQSLFEPHMGAINLVLSGQTSAVCTGTDLAGTKLTTALALPLLESGKFAGLLYVDTTVRDFAFNKLDLDFLEALSNQATIAITKAHLEERSKQDAQVMSRLEKHVGSQVAQIAREKKIDLETSDMETQEKEVTILFSDIAGFTSLSEKLSPSEIAFLLNGYFNHMADCVAKYNGYLNKYIGDAVMAVFGAPHTMGNDAANAIHCGLEMLERLQVFWKSIDESKRFKIRIGINTGVVTAGNIGSLSRMEYTVIGDAVNLASRLESKAEPLSILIGEKTYQYVRDLFRVQPFEPIRVKGKEEPVMVYKILP